MAGTQLQRGMDWVKHQFAEALGLTPDMLDWEEHNAGVLLQVPVDNSLHHVSFAKDQIESCADGAHKDMSKWIAEHAKEAKRSPSPKDQPYECKLTHK